MPRCTPRRSLRSTLQQILKRLSRRCCFLLPQSSLFLLPCIFGIVYILPKILDACYGNRDSRRCFLRTKPFHYSAADLAAQQKMPLYAAECSPYASLIPVTSTSCAGVIQAVLLAPTKVQLPYCRVGLCCTVWSWSKKHLLQYLWQCNPDNMERPDVTRFGRLMFLSSLDRAGVDEVMVHAGLLGCLCWSMTRRLPCWRR